MKCRHCLALNVSPLIARLVLAATFLWFGFGKLQTIEYTGEDAQILIKLGVGEVVGTGADDGGAALPAETRGGTSLPSGMIDSLRGEVAATAFAYQDEGDNKGENAQATEATPDEDAGGDEMGDGGEDSGEEVTTTDARVRGYRFHMITLMLYRAGNTHPVAMARMALVTETIGGLLILVGLFTRLWGLGLAVVMAFAFYLTTWAGLVAIVNDPAVTGLSLVYKGLSSIGKLDFNAQISAFNQLALFGLSMIVFVSGPGALSLDHLLFRSRTKMSVDSVDEDVDS